MPARGFAQAESSLRVVFSEDVLSTVNQNDALASFRAWIAAVGSRRGLDLTVRSETYNGTPELRSLVERGGPDLFIVDSMDYLRLEGEDLPWDPYFIPETGGSAERTYLLVTRRGQEESLTDLRDKRVVILKNKGVTLTERWLELLLQEAGVGGTETFFSSVETVTKPSAAVLPVFFGKADVCVVDQPGFDIMEEMNPQVGAQLHSLLSSPPYVETVICIHKHKADYREDLIDGLSGLGGDPAGKQILMVFQIDGLAPFENDLLTTVRTLRSALDPTAVATEAPQVTEATP